MVRTVDVVSQVLQEYVFKAAELSRKKQIKDKEQWEECRKSVDAVKENFTGIVEQELRKNLTENPVFNKNMHLDIMIIPEAVIEEHIRTGGYISVCYSKVPMLQELVDLVKQEGLEPFISHRDSETPGKKHDATFQVTIPDKLLQSPYLHVVNAV